MPVVLPIIGVGGPRMLCSRDIFSTYCHFVVWKVASQTKYCYSPKIKLTFWPSKKLWAGYATAANAETKYRYLVLPMQKLKHNWNSSVKYFTLRIRFRPRLVLKRLKLHQFLMVWHERFPAQKHGCRKRGRNFKISAKNAVFLISSGKDQISPYLSPRRKMFGKSISASPLEKFPPTPMHTSMWNDTIFVKNYVVLHHLATLFNNTNAVSNP